MQWKKIAASALMVAFIAAPALPVLAVPAPASVPTTGVPTTIDTFYTLICDVSNWLFAFIMIIAIIILLYGALLFFTAGGSEDQVATARRFLTYALVGIAVAVLARSLIFVVGSFLGATSTGFFAC